MKTHLSRHDSIITLLTCQYPMQKDGQLKVLIADATGRVVSVEELYQSAGNHEYVYDTKALGPGLYFYRFITPTGKHAGKFLKAER